MAEKEEILNETLYKKNKELQSIQKLNEEIKREYEEKIKNLEGSISTLKKQNAEMYAQAQDNKRIEIIEKLKSERKEQEQVITLIRKMINNDKDVNLYLSKEFFTKNGENRKFSYEELKIKIKEKEEELKKLKSKSNTMSMTLLTQNKKGKDKKNKVTDTFLQQKIIEKFKDQINDYDEQINELQEENESLKKSKKEMEDAQNDLLEKMREYNEEVDQMQIKYNMIKDDVKKTSTEKINNLNSTIEKLKNDNSKYKKRILELINKGEKNEKQDKDKLSKMNRDYDIYSKLLETKIQEIEDYRKELDELKEDIKNIGTNELLKISRLENQANELNKDKFSLEADIKNLNNVIQQKDNQIKNLKNTQSALTEEIEIKAQEIILLNEKIAEFEELLKRKNIVEQI
jgi:predicted  nucleic acid-binding Zn-ribbon protein